MTTFEFQAKRGDWLKCFRAFLFTVIQGYADDYPIPDARAGLGEPFILRVPIHDDEIDAVAADLWFRPHGKFEAELWSDIIECQAFDETIRLRGE